MSLIKRNNPAVQGAEDQGVSNLKAWAFKTSYSEIISITLDPPPPRPHPTRPT
jgi:hypothetical protein